MDLSEDNIDTKISLIENLLNYIEGVIKGKYNDDNNSNEISLRTIILEYYNERIDYDSNYFDPYAFINDENDDILKVEVDDIKLFSHFHSYLIKVIDGDITDTETIESLYNMIKVYYKERVNPLSKYFDSFAFNNDLNEIMDELNVSESESMDTSGSEAETSESEMETESEEINDPMEIDPFLSKFINGSENDDILLYQMNDKPVSKLENFLNINNYY